MLQISPDCVGPSFPGIDAKIADDEGNTLPDGTEGSITAWSPMVMIEYFGHPRRTRKR
jgi:acyl-coenzyme A synthetase/AMP-(fatty) acid ligase